MRRRPSVRFGSTMHAPGRPRTTDGWSIISWRSWGMKPKKTAPSRRRVSFAVDRAEIEINSDWVQAVMASPAPPVGPAENTDASGGVFFAPRLKTATGEEALPGERSAAVEEIAPAEKIDTVEQSASGEDQATVENPTPVALFAMPQALDFR